MGTCFPTRHVGQVGLQDALGATVFRVLQLIFEGRDGLYPSQDSGVSYLRALPDWNGEGRKGC